MAIFIRISDVPLHYITMLGVARTRLIVHAVTLEVIIQPL